MRLVLVPDGSDIEGWLHDARDLASHGKGEEEGHGARLEPLSLTSGLRCSRLRGMLTVARRCSDCTCGQQSDNYENVKHPA